MAYVNPLSSWMSSDIFGIGNGFCLIFAFSRRNSETTRTVPNVFAMINVGAACAESLHFSNTHKIAQPLYILSGGLLIDDRYWVWMCFVLVVIGPPYFAH